MSLPLVFIYSFESFICSLMISEMSAIQPEHTTHALTSVSPSWLLCLSFVSCKSMSSISAAVGMLDHLISLILGTSSISKHRCSGFMSEIAMSCPENGTPQFSSPCSGFYILFFCPPLLQCPLSFWGGREGLISTSLFFFFLFFF